MPMPQPQGVDAAHQGAEDDADAAAWTEDQGELLVVAQILVDELGDFGHGVTRFP